LENEKSIDEKLAEANAEFDSRLAKEKHEAKTAAPVERTKPKTQEKRAIAPKSNRHKPGEVAHGHWQEREDDMVEVDCLYVEHFVNDRKGFAINGVRHSGKVIVPQCVANYLSKMENDYKANERAIFEDRGRRVFVGEVSG
jgi:chemotaxis protein histidine kinase CheA